MPYDLLACEPSIPPCLLPSRRNQERTAKMATIRKSISVTALASLIALPLVLSASGAEAASCHTRKFNGTLLGAAGGALLGGAVLGGAVSHGSTGPIVGGLAGAVVG